MAKSGNHIVDGLKRTSLEAEKAVRKQLNNLSKRYSGPEVRQVLSMGMDRGLIGELGKN